MPKIVDHQQRKIEIAEITWRLIQTQGLEAVSLRAIAKELGMTTGVLWSYFKDKESLMMFMLDHVFGGDLTLQMVNAAKGTVGVDRIEQMVTASLPLTKQRSQAWQYWVKFLSVAVSREALGAAQRARYTRFRQALRKELKSLDTDGQLSRVHRLEFLADAIVVMVDGIGVDHVLDPKRFNAKHQRSLVQLFLKGLLETATNVKKR